MIEHVVGRRCYRARLTRRVSRSIILPAVTFYPVRGPLVRMIPLLDVAFTPLPRTRAVRRKKVVGSDWVPVQLLIWSGTLHAFPAIPVPVPDILAARAVAAEFIRESVDAVSLSAVDVVA